MKFTTEENIFTVDRVFGCLIIAESFCVYFCFPTTWWGPLVLYAVNTKHSYSESEMTNPCRSVEGLQFPVTLHYCAPFHAFTSFTPICLDIAFWSDYYTRSNTRGIKERAIGSSKVKLWISWATWILPFICFVAAADADLSAWIVFSIAEYSYNSDSHNILFSSLKET